MELSELGKLPIEGSDPAGRNIRADDIYEQLVTEINKREALKSSDRVIDWQRVVTLSQEILQHHSKDILVCSYLCVGLFQLDGLKGFANGVRIYCNLLETFWPNLYPPRLSGRKSAIGWWVESVNERIRDLAKETWQSEDLEVLEQDVERLLNLFDGYQLASYAEVKSIFTACKALILVTDATVNLATELVEPVPTWQEAQKVDEAIAVEKRLNREPVAAGIEAIAVDVGRALRPVFSALNTISTAISHEQPFCYQVFRINRFIAWLDIDGLPPADRAFRTLLPAPDGRILDTLHRLELGQHWNDLLIFAEGLVCEFRFWLDLSYYVCKALSALNQQLAAEELAHETLIYFKRLVGIELLTFADGTPFASNDTREWLNCLSPGQNSNPMIAAVVGDDELVVGLDEAKQLVAEGKLEVALNRLHRLLQASTTVREHFIRLMSYCRFVDLIKHTYLAKPYLCELLAISKRHQLDNWEPSLASSAYQLILSIASQKKFKLEEETLAEVLKRLTLIDPVSSLKFQG